MIDHMFEDPFRSRPGRARRTVVRVPEPTEVERAALVALLRTRPGGRSWTELADRIADAGTAYGVWQELGADSPTLFDPDEGPLSAATADLRAWVEEGLRVLTFLDDDFPSQLREIQEMPPILFARGTLAADERGVSVVGSRAATPEALRFAERTATELVRAGVTVISGLAAGVDTAAHRAALAAGGRTVAVIGTGIRRCYPQENQGLQDRIAAEGLVLSQFWPDATPQRHSFPMRNAVMSGYGRATIVVAAGEKSGARIQARVAVAHGRPVILTDAVVQGTQWGRALRGRAGVHVAGTVPEAVATALEATEPLPRRLEAFLPAT